MRFILSGVASRTYRLIVAGELGDTVSVAFQGLTVTHADGNTMLTGTIRDQAELQSILQRVSDFGLTLLEVSAVKEPSAG